MKYIDSKEIDKDVNSDREYKNIYNSEFISNDEIVAFKGNVTSVSNILIEYGAVKKYYTIATILVEKRYKGNIEEGKTLNVLVPCSYVDGICIQNSDTATHLTVGMTGIFTPIVCDDSGEKYYFKSEDNKIALSDIADYWLADGIKWGVLKNVDKDK